MSNTAVQTLANHGRIDPPYHAILFFVLLPNLGIVSVNLFLNPGLRASWLMVLSIASIILYAKLRLYPLKVQDRLIRLEERLRLQALAPTEWHPKVLQLSIEQLVALRFASDEEVVELAHQALNENLNVKQIKVRIKNWRADYWRA